MPAASPFDGLLAGRRLLLVVATAKEAAALPGPAKAEPWTLYRGGLADVVISGIGKANAAAAVARVLDPESHGLVLSVGIAGALPRRGDPMLPLGLVVGATECLSADEGIETPSGYQSVAQMGFPLGAFAGDGPKVDPEVGRALLQVCEFQGPIATVSTCSGTDARAMDVSRRTGAIAEAMEGAAVAQVAVRLGVRFGEIRVISNTTGDRERQRWDLAGALRRLGEVLGPWAV